MEVKATYRFARISAFKAREVTREIQGLQVQDALDTLKWTPKKAARLVDQTLRSAVANAENNNDLRAERLRIKEAVVGEGPSMRRFVPKARGSAGPIRKRTSHIRIVLTDEQPPVTEKARPTATSAKSTKSAKANEEPEPETAPAETASAETETTKE